MAPNTTMIIRAAPSVRGTRRRASKRMAGLSRRLRMKARMIGRTIAAARYSTQSSSRIN
jgi:hypothetical protein